MKDMINHKDIPDDDVVFYDGFLYIISASKVICKDGFEETSYKTDVICLCPEFDDPISLKDIANNYPHVRKVLFEDWREGFVYSYGNWKKGEWALIGTTIGFA